MQTHHVLYKGLPIELAAIRKELFKQLILADQVIFELDPGYTRRQGSVIGMQQCVSVMS